MTKTTTAALALTAALASGCATDKPLLQQASEGLNSARASAANFIAPSSAASAPTATTTASPTAPAAKKVGVTFDKAYDGKVPTNAVVAAGRGVAANFTSLNKEYVAVTIKDSNRNSKATPVTFTGQIALESCSPTATGTAAAIATNVGTRVGGALTQGLANMLPGGGGAVGNVVRTQTQRATVQSGNEVKTSILSGATNLTQEQQIACKADMATVSAEIKSFATEAAKDFSVANKGSKPVVTYTGTGDLKDLQLGVGLGRSPK